MKKRSASTRSAARATAKKRQYLGAQTNVTEFADDYRCRVRTDWRILPVDLLRAIDREARRIGVTRQAFIKLADVRYAG